MEKIFKAKRLDNGEWHVFGLFDIEWSDDDSLKVKLVTKFLDTFVFVSKNTICQYTGIDDKEGNRIFEGDELEHWIDGFKYAFFARWDSEDACYDGDCLAWRWRDLRLTGHNIHDRG